MTKTIRTSYKVYRKDNKDLFKTNPSYNLTFEEYRAINYSFNRKVADKIIAGGSVKLPHSMGELRIRKFKLDPDKPLVDFNATKIARKKDPNAKAIYHLNFHSDGFGAAFKWKRRIRAIGNLKSYVFQIARGNDGKSPAERMTKIMKTPGGHNTYNEW